MVLGPWHRSGHPSHHCMEISRVANPPPPSRQMRAARAAFPQAGFGVSMHVSLQGPSSCCYFELIADQPGVVPNTWLQHDVFLKQSIARNTHTQSHLIRLLQRRTQLFTLGLSPPKAGLLGGTRNNYYHYILISCCSTNIESESY